MHLEQSSKQIPIKFSFIIFFLFKNFLQAKKFTRKNNFITEQIEAETLKIYHFNFSGIFLEDKFMHKKKPHKSWQHNH